MELLLIKQPYTISFAGNPIAFTFGIIPYGTREQAESYQVILRVEVEDDFNSGFFVEVKEYAFYPEDDGSASTDIRTILNAFLTTFIPPLTQEIPVPVEGAVKRYRISYRLLKNNQLVDNTVTTSPIYYALAGGFSYQEWHPKKYFTQVLVNNKPFLRYTAAKEYVFADERKYLSWIYPYNDLLVQTIKVIIGFSDNTASAEINLPQTLQVVQWQPCITPAGFNQVELAAQVPVGKSALWYQVRVVNSANVVVAEPQKFYLDYRNFYETRDLLFVNSLNAIETIRLRGQVDMEAEYTTTSAEKVTPPEYFSQHILKAHKEDTYNAELTTFKGDTGFLAKDVLDRLLDLFLSDHVYEIKNNRLIPVNIIAKNNKWYSNKQDLYSISIDWQHAFMNEHYTPPGSIGTVQACPAVETFVARQTGADKLTIAWALESGYDKILVDVTVAGVVSTYTFKGNHGQEVIPFTNPADPQTYTLSLTYTVTNNGDGTQTIVFTYNYDGVGDVSIDYRPVGSTIFTNTLASSPESITVPVGNYEFRFREFSNFFNFAITPFFVAANTIIEPVEFTNGGNAEITFSAKTICNDLIDPADVGPALVVPLTVQGKVKPTAVADIFEAPSTSPITFEKSVLENDYDDNGSPLAVVPASGVALRGGTFSIDAAGIVTFDPALTFSFFRWDRFEYTLTQTDANPLTATGTVTIRKVSSGNNGIVYIKVNLRNRSSQVIEGIRHRHAEVWLEFYSDAAGTNPVDVTGQGLDITVKKIKTGPGAGETTNIYTGIGIDMRIYTGEISTSVYFLNSLITNTTWEVQSGSGYVKI